MKRKGIILFILGLILSLFSPSLIGAKANSAQHSFFGTYASGIISTDETSPVVVTKEDLVFYIDSFPTLYDTENLSSYDSRVSATYTFHNPAAYNVTSRLVFPLGTQPDYIDNEDYLNAVAGYDIKVDDVVVDKTIRYTYSNTNQFNIEEDLPRLRDTVQDHDFFNDELAVFRYEVRVTAPSVQSGTDIAVEINVPSDFTGIIISNKHRGHQTTFSGAKIRYWIDNADSFFVYTLGQPFDTFADNITVFDSFYQGDEIDATATIVNKVAIDFDSLINRYRDDIPYVNDVDYKNAMIDWLDERFATNRTRFDNEYVFNIQHHLLTWYDYEMTVNAGESVTNQVIAPLFPHVRTDYDPSVYNYDYLLTPASTWADFSNLTIEIVTPYYLTTTNILGFSKTATGYILTLDELPEEDLTFQLSTGENPVRRNTGLEIVISILAGIGAVIGLAVLSVYAMGGLVLIIYFSIRASKKNQRR
ncbi:MAG TPA: hypothetical protein VJZ48_02695 [Bacilli bacterium]|nr:hypothetical protein [Bacilli bacterium]